jgi:hypothetical protein
MNKEEAKDQLIQVLYSQVIDLTMMSKIELGDDVIAEIQRLKNIITEDSIMKAAHALAKKEEPLFKDKLERTNHVVNTIDLANWDSLKNQNLDAPLISWEDELIEPRPFEICLGVGLNQFFPEYITFNLTEDGSNEA